MSAVIGVIGILTLPDFVRTERTYALTQLAGRAGRGSQAGHVLVQTRHPDHFVFKLLAAKHLEDPSSLLPTRSIPRGLLSYPISKMVLIRLEVKTHKFVQYGKVAGWMRQLSRNAKDISIIDLRYTTSKLVGRYRVQILLKGTNSKTFRHWLKQVRHILRETSITGAKLVLDVDPKNLL